MGKEKPKTTTITAGALALLLLAVVVKWVWGYVFNEKHESSPPASTQLALTKGPVQQVSDAGRGNQFVTMNGSSNSVTQNVTTTINNGPTPQQVIEMVEKPTIATISELNKGFPLGWVMFAQTNGQFGEMDYQTEHRGIMDIDWRHDFDFTLGDEGKMGTLLLMKLVFHIGTGISRMDNCGQNVSVEKGKMTAIMGAVGMPPNSVQLWFYAYDPDNRIFVIGVTPETEESKQRFYAKPKQKSQGN